VSYTPTTDFVALLRQTSDGVEFGRMPGLDFVLAAMARAGLVTPWTGQTAPTANLASTAWIKPASPSWSAEGVVYLYDANASAFVPATPALWSALLASSSGYVFQNVTGAADVVGGSTTLLAVRRTITVDGTTTLTLPVLATRGNVPLRIVDWSAIVLSTHIIALSTPDGAAIMRRSTLDLYSTPDQLAGVTLYPSPDLNGWVIAP
jgi:CelD/BcsL family acetyltransferase involved in cellulose biosynthesis